MLLESSKKISENNESNGCIDLLFKIYIWFSKNIFDHNEIYWLIYELVY